MASSSTHAPSVSINVLFDGTANDATDPDAGAKGDTNVGRMTDLIANKNKLGQSQFWIYYSGLGTTAGKGPHDSPDSNNSKWAKAQNLRSILDHVASGYQFVCENYAADLSVDVGEASQLAGQNSPTARSNDGNVAGKDTVNTFGFSRGGATALFLAQLLSQVGVIKRQGTSEENFTKEWVVTKAKDFVTSSHTIDAIKEHVVRVKASSVNLGLYDPVASIGAPDQLKPSWIEHPWAFTLDLNEDFGFCMVIYAAAEHRNNFKPMILKGVRFSTWVPTYHSSCGGGTDQKNKMTIICLIWMLGKFENRLSYDELALETIIREQCSEQPPAELTDSSKGSLSKVPGTQFSRAKAIQEDEAAEKHETADPEKFTELTGIKGFPAQAAAVFDAAGENVKVEILTAFDRKWLERISKAGDLPGPKKGPPTERAGLHGIGAHQTRGKEETFDDARERRKQATEPAAGERPSGTT